MLDSNFSCFVFLFIALIQLHIVGQLVLWLDEWITNSWNPPLPDVAARLPNDEMLHTLFFPGSLSDLTQAARYMGPRGFKLPQNGGSRVYHRDAALLFSNLWIAQPHGVVETYWSTRTPYAFDVTPLLRGFLTGVRGGFDVEHRWWKWNLAQTDDVAHGLRMVRDAFARCENENHQFILYGVSTGAATALQVAALLTPEELRRVRFMVLEGIFNNVNDMLTYRFGKVLGAVVSAVLVSFTRYSPSHAATPLSVARAFPHKDLPIALVTSEADSVVDPAMVKRIRNALRDEAGVKFVDFLKLRDSPHSDYATHNKDDRNGYVEFMSQMYDRTAATKPSEY